ncbi:MAG: hypothetical protein JWR22_2311 [Herminiimonas sp.]|nr:hypothetical protein [Herminiimonas sp.]
MESVDGDGGADADPDADADADADRGKDDDGDEDTGFPFSRAGDGFLFHVQGHFPDVLNGDAHPVAALDGADAFRRAGGDDVARIERGDS